MPKPKLTDLAIRKLIQSGERFSGISDGFCKGLYLCWPKHYAVPFWRFRYKVKGKSRALGLGQFGSVNLAEARKIARELRARIQLGFDPALEKRERRAETLAKEQALQLQRTVAELTEEFMVRHVDGRLKRPVLVRQRLAKHIQQSSIGRLPVEGVKPLHIDGLIQGVVKQGKHCLANDLLRSLKRIFDFGVTRHYLLHNPAAAFHAQDAGGQAVARERALSLDEIAVLLGKIKSARNFAPENALAVRLLLLLGVRKMELLGAKWEEFDLDAGVWNLPAARSKTASATRLPLSGAAVEHFRALNELACNSRFVFPRRIGAGDARHMAESTLNLALYGLKTGLEPFTVHDLRRTVRTQLGALKIPPHICERCLNHKIGGVQGVYDRYDYWDERKSALEAWAAVLAGLESDRKVTPIGNRKAATMGKEKG